MIRQEINNILSELSKRKVNHVILRNFEFLLNSELPLENDLDILIAPSNLKLAEQVLSIYKFKKKKSFLNKIQFRKFFGDKLFLAF